MNEQPDTRQDPSNLLKLIDDVDSHDNDANLIEDNVLELKELMGVRTALEGFRDQVKAAGVDGLDPVAKELMRVNPAMLKQNLPANASLESIDIGGEEITFEDFSSALKGVGDRISAVIQKLIDMAKQFASRIMSGVETVKTQSEQLLDQLRNRGKSKASMELHDGEREITIDSPGILFADGKFCLDECRSEQEVIKFFLQQWPKYANDQINRAKKMISEYDVESGNSDNFNSNAGFIGNHESLVGNIKTVVLPGNKQIGFKYVALGPELVDAEGAAEAPGSHSFAVRTEAEIQGTLRKNIATMDAMGKMFKEEADVLQNMTTLSQALMGLENRRGETVWKSAREGLDEISNVMMDLITRLKPNYDPIVRHLARVGTARNAACRKEMAALA